MIFAVFSDANHFERRIIPAAEPDAFADRRRKAIAVAQSLALLCSLAPATPPSCAAATCTVALGLLVYSFAADIVMQQRASRG